MYIEPNTGVRILHNIPLDTTYEHTIWFDNATDQRNYFLQHAKHALLDQTYQRVNSNRMRVQVKADNLYDCNYLMFQNTNFGNKWFYAFIKKVEYVNNITSEIEYELDVMQTWFFDYSLGQCFVEREHSATDNVGDNLVPENVELGEYVCDNITRSTKFNDLSIVLATSADETNKYYGEYREGLYHGLHYISVGCNENEATVMNDFIKLIDEAGRSNAILGLFVIPTVLLKIQGNHTYPWADNLHRSKPTRLGSYTPRNNKLLTYPYNFEYVTNQQGNSAAFRYEFFNGSDCIFYLTGDSSPSPTVLCAPINYKGASINWDEKIPLTGFPQLSFNVDTYKAWLAQSHGSRAADAVATAAGALLSGVSSPAGAGTAILSGVNYAARMIGQFTDKEITPPQSKGSVGGATLAALRQLDYLYMNKHITPEFAEIIDGFFDVYGYACHKVKYPNRNVRERWTYTKTVNCVVHGSVPCDDMDKITHVYNNGVTFWRNGEDIGKYYLSNNIRGDID